MFSNWEGIEPEFVVFGSASPLSCDVCSWQSCALSEKGEGYYYVLYEIFSSSSSPRRAKEDNIISHSKSHNFHKIEKCFLEGKHYKDRYGFQYAIAQKKDCQEEFGTYRVKPSKTLKISFSAFASTLNKANPLGTVKAIVHHGKDTYEVLYILCKSVSDAEEKCTEDWVTKYFRLEIFPEYRLNVEYVDVSPAIAYANKNISLLLKEEGRLRTRPKTDSNKARLAEIEHSLDFFYGLRSHGKATCKGVTTWYT